VTNFTYTWDANKRKTAENDGIVPPVNSQTFAYDDENRLTSFARQNGQTQSWNLSLVGDWSSFNDNGTLETRTHNAVHELTAINGNPLTYDLKGNLTGNSNGQGYVWDFENRMSSAVVGANTATYAYDALGRRVSKTFGGVTTVFVNDGLQEIAEYEGVFVVGSPARSYVFGSYIDEPLMMVAGGVKTYYHANNLYSVAALTNQVGAVVERYTYDPYGKVKILAANGVTVLAASSVGNPWTFQGRRLDTETGLMYYRTRTYDVNLGRFLNRMPWHAMGGKVSFVSFLPSVLIASDRWWGSFQQSVLTEARGSYIQNRFSLYEYMKESPTNYVEPFSSGWGAPFLPPTPPSPPPASSNPAIKKLVCVLKCVNKGTNGEFNNEAAEFANAFAANDIHSGWALGGSGIYNPLTFNTTITLTGDCKNDAITAIHEARRRLPGGIGGQNASGALPIDAAFTSAFNTLSPGCCKTATNTWSTEFVPSGIFPPPPNKPVFSYCKDVQSGCISPNKPGTYLGEKCCCECDTPPWN